MIQARQRTEKEQKRVAEEAYRKCLDIITSDVGLKTVMSDVLESYGREVFSSRKFRGVFARDEIPELKEGQGCIVNNQNHDEEGEHWLALARGSRSGLLLQYDSFGRKNFLVLGIDDSKDTERDAEQGDEEENCGNRCLAFLAVFFLLGEQYAVWI